MWNLTMGMWTVIQIFGISVSIMVPMNISQIEVLMGKS